MLDATAATGIRGIRYALESKTKNPTLLEINPAAYNALRANLLLNKIKATAVNRSIQEFANTCDTKFDFIDLDPFGGITPYIFDLMKIVTNGTRLMVTATDTAVLCGAEAKACARLYDAKPVHNEVCHEGGMRIMIGYIARVAAQFGIGVDVDLSVSYMHYMRCFLKLSIGAEKAQETISKMGYLKYCDGCGAFGTEVGFVPKELKCANCGKQMAAYGRMWFGRLKDQKIVDSLYKSIDDDEEKEAKKLLEVIKSEIETPFYYHIPTLTKRCKMGSVSPYAVASNLKRGHRVSFTHMKDSAIKTDASIGEVISAIKDCKT